MDLMPLPLSERVKFDGKKKTEFARRLHEDIHLNVAKQTEQYAKHANKGR